MSWYLAVLKKYAVFSGRARRKEYWMFALFNFIALFILGVIAGIVGATSQAASALIIDIYALALVLPSLAVGVRRMHDSDHSGWWILVPLVNLVFAVTDGTPGDNRFGPDPKGGTSGADDEVLTNDAVLAMVNSHLGDDVILSKIRYARSDFQMSSSQLADLKRHGASDAVISAMLESQAHRRTPPVARKSTGTNVIVVLAVIVGGFILLSIIAAIAVPGLLRARMSGNEASAIASLRAINSAENTYASNCAFGGYAVRLEDLAAAPGGGTGFISPDLNANGVVKSGYIITLSRGAGARDVGGTTACNGTISQPASSYYASAVPVTPGSSGARGFATDTRGTIFFTNDGTAPPNPIPTGSRPVQ